MSVPQFPRESLMERLEGGSYCAFNAVITGQVDLQPDASVWFGCVLRGDDAPIVIGARSNIQDLTMVHADYGVPNVIGEEVTVGHRCVLHGAEVGDRCLIGMGAILLSGSRIGSESIVAAGAVVKENFTVPPRSLVAGVPARILRSLGEEDVLRMRASADGYVSKIRQYLAPEGGLGSNSGANFP